MAFQSRQLQLSTVPPSTNSCPTDGANSLAQIHWISVRRKTLPDGWWVLWSCSFWQQWMANSIALAEQKDINWSLRANLEYGLLYLLWGLQLFSIRNIFFINIVLEPCHSLTSDPHRLELNSVIPLRWQWKKQWADNHCIQILPSFPPLNLLGNIRQDINVLWHQIFHLSKWRWKYLSWFQTVILRNIWNNECIVVM